MRKLIVLNAMSLDGYHEGPGKDVMAVEEALGGPFDEYLVERLRAADTLLLGRTTYDGFKGFWPGMVDDPDATATEREISRLNNEIDKVVVSDTLTPAQTAPWHNTSIISRSGAHERIAALKRESGKEILVGGSQTLWSDLLAHGLVDEVHLMVGPVVVGGGTPVFDGPPPAPLRLIGTRTWEGSDKVLLCYGLGRE
jgi:dihydrofolate reductase